MLFVFRVSAAANTARADAVKTDLKVKAGVITKIDILIPNGHHSLAHLVIRDGDTPFVPEHAEIGVIGDGVLVTWLGWKEIKKTPYTLKAEVWNEDDTYPHAFIIYMTVLPQWLAYPFGKLIEVFNKLAARLTIRRLS